MHTNMLLCFHWNVFKYVVVAMKECNEVCCCVFIGMYLIFIYNCCLIIR